MAYVLIILFGSGFTVEGATKIGLYSSQDRCEAARQILIADKTPVKGGHALCIPIDQESPNE